MAIRIAGVTLPSDKRIEAALTAIYGIGLSNVKEILKKAQVNPDTRVKELKDDDAYKIRNIVEKEYKVEGDLRRDVLSNIKRLKEIDSYRGSRHSKKLPLHGQRTKTNSRTVRENTRKTMGSGKKPPAQKT